MKKKGESTKKPPSSLYQNTIDSIDSMIHLIDPEMKISLVNKRFSEWTGQLGLKLGNVLGKYLFDVFPFLPRQVHDEYRRVFETGKTLITEELTEVKGKKIVTETKKIPIFENQKVFGIVTMVTDITSRKEYEEELKSREEKFRFLFEQSNDSIFLLAPDGTIIDCNQGTSDLLGYPKDEIIGKNYEVFVADRYLDDSRQKLDLLKKGLKPFQYEKEFVGKGNKIIPVEINPTPVLDQQNNLKWIQSVVRDISERKRAEQLQRILFDISEKTFMSKDLPQLYRALHLILGQLMSVKNFYIAIYDPATELLSFPYFIDEYDPAPESKKLGKGLTEYVLQTEQPLLLTRELSEILEKKQEIELVGTDCVSWLGIPLKTSSGETFGVLVVQSYDEYVHYTSRDKDVLMFVSQQIANAIERKKTEEKLRETEIQFYHLQKVESIGTLMGTIAHDYNNILTSILGNAQLIEYNIPQQDTTLSKYVNAIIKASESAAGLVQQLLTFTRGMEQNFEVIDIHKIITDWIELLRQIVGDPIRIMHNLTADKYHVWGNAEKIRQVIMNLIINARDAMPSGGNILIETKNEDYSENKYIHDDYVKAGSYVQMVIKDNGMGMEKSMIPEIFKPFFSTKSKEKGTGLGLSIVKRIIHEMNAHINVESQPKKGTSVYIWFLQYEAADEKEDENGNKLIFRGMGEIVLLVEDDDEVRSMLQNLLEDHLGYTTLTASNGKEALKILEKNQVSLIITDLKMPDVDGITLLNSVKKKYPNLQEKVVAITAFSENHESRLVDLGFCEVIKKPIRIDKFSEIIHKILRNELDQSKTTGK